MYDFSRKYEILKMFFFLIAESEYKGLPQPGYGWAVRRFI